MMKWIMLYYDALEECKLLTDEQFGRLVREALHFAKTGQETELSAPEAYLWPGLKNRLIRDKESYEDKCRKNAENINKRWEQQREPEAEPEEPEPENPEPPPDGYERIRPNTNVYESYEEKEEVKEESKIESEKNEKNYYKIKSESEIKSENNARRKLRAEGYSDGEIDGALSRIPEGSQIRSLRAYLKKAIDEERREKRIGKRVPAQEYSQRDYSGEQERAFQRMMEEIERDKQEQDQGGTYRPPQPGTPEEQINRLKEVIANEEREKQRISGGT